MQFVPGPAQLVRTRLAVHAYVRAVSLAFPFSRAREGRRRIKNQDAAKRWGVVCVCARTVSFALPFRIHTHIHNRSSILACARRKVKKEEQGRLRAMGLDTYANVRP